MIQHFSRKWGQPVLEQCLCPVSMSYVLAMGYLLPEFPPSWLSPDSTFPLRGMVPKNLFGVVESQRSFFRNFFQLRWDSGPYLLRTTEFSPYSIQRLKRNSWGHHGCCMLVSFSITLRGWLETLQHHQFDMELLSLEDTNLTSKLNKQGPTNNKNSNVIKGPKRSSSHIKLGNQEVKVSLIPWPCWLYLCSHSACSYIFLMLVSTIPELFT